MKNNYILDTSFLSALFLIRDFHHFNAVKVLSQLPADSNIILPVTVLMEVEVLNRKLDFNLDKSISGFIRMYSVEIVYIDEEFLNSYKIVSKVIKPVLKAIDLSIVTTAINLNAKVLTFDIKLDNTSKNT